MRLIDADVLKKLILAERDKIPLTVPAAPYELVKEKPYTDGKFMRCGIRKALKCMEQTPTIEAEPVRHGRWIEIKTIIGEELVCSLCRNHDNPKTAIRGHYCWFCGAKMDLK